MSDEQKTEYIYYCPNCGAEVKSDTVECNLCGFPIAEKGGAKQVKKPIKIPDLPYQALSTKGEIWYFLAGKFYKHLTFQQKVFYHLVNFILVMFTFIGIKIYLNYDKIAPYLDDEVYWVELLDGTTEFITIPDNCGSIIERMVNNETITEEEILKLRNTVPQEDALRVYEGLLYRELKQKWWNDNVGFRFLVILNISAFEAKVYPQEEIQPN